MKKRTWIQLLFFTFVFLVAFNHFLEESQLTIPLIPSLSLHAICPFGGAETFFSLILYDHWIAKIHPSSLVLFVIVLFTSILFGPMFCSHICPLGSIQEWVSKIGRKLFKKKFNKFIPYTLDKYLRYTRYVTLALILYVTTESLTLAFLNIDPYYALFNFYTGEVTIGALLVLGLTLLLSLFVERPFCKYFCPFGAILGVTNTFRLFKLKRLESSCVNCGLCDKACPMNIPVSKKGIVRDHQCISCFECTSEAACPIDETVIVTLGGKK